jgi:hypothetical protein
MPDCQSGAAETVGGADNKRRCAEGPWLAGVIGPGRDATRRARVLGRSGGERLSRSVMGR